MILWIWQFIEYTSKKLTKFLFGHNIFIISNNELLWSFIQRTNSELSPMTQALGYRMQWLYISFYQTEYSEFSKYFHSFSSGICHIFTHHQLSLTCFPPYFFWQVKKQNKILKANTNAEILGWGRSIEMIHLILPLCYI